MLVLRCTQKLLARLKQADNLPAIESTTRLGDWYGNVLQLGRRQHLLFISETLMHASLNASGQSSAVEGLEAATKWSP